MTMNLTMATFPNTSSRIPSSAASTNATLAKSSEGLLFYISGFNAAVATRFLKLYNKATAPTVGTDTPLLTIAIPASSAFVLDFSRGVDFDTGIGYALTTGAADNDTGAVAAADILGLNILYT
jgi:hypothetical protein